jgi:hypothetical protein
MLTIKIESPKAFRLMDIQLSTDMLPIVHPSSRHDAKPFVGCSAFVSMIVDIIFKRLFYAVKNHKKVKPNNPKPDSSFLSKYFDSSQKETEGKQETKQKPKV